jgi:hypothetical protein
LSQVSRNKKVSKSPKKKGSPEPKAQPAQRGPKKSAGNKRSQSPEANPPTKQTRHSTKNAGNVEKRRSPVMLGDQSDAEKTPVKLTRAAAAQGSTNKTPLKSAKTTAQTLKNDDLPPRRQTRHQKSDVDKKKSSPVSVKSKKHSPKREARALRSISQKDSRSP